ncbi:COG1470 family protein [Azospirillum brasilense]|uniref:COG1470 family protein n=1 Tax=Azospirillum brasilense TaxID=192 RepID=UPI001FFF0D4F|nr:sulfotransferase family 2 domain-containing protein [Azospirillum brasilense]
MKILVDHIRKTAGTSVGDFFRGLSGSERVTPLLMDESILISEHLFRDHDVVIGHFVLSHDYHWPKSVYHTTILRDPIERFISHYSYVRERKEASEPFARLAQTRSLPELLDECDFHVREASQNYYCNHFMGGMYAKEELESISSSGKINAEDIFEFMKESYQFVGISEFLKLSLGAICFGNAVNANLVDIRSRVTGDRLSVDSLDRATLRKLQDLTANDMDLYRLCRERFFKHLERVTQFALHRMPAPHRNAEDITPRMGVPNASMTFVGAELMCPERPRNDVGVSSQECWLATKFRMENFPQDCCVSITIRNSVKQVMYRERRPFAFTLKDGGFVEFLWFFNCTLGADTYDVSLDVRSMVNGLPETLIASSDNFYQFQIVADGGHDATGLCNLQPEFRVIEQASAYDAARGSLSVAAGTVTVRPGESVTLPVRVRNEGAAAWQPAGFHCVAASYWLEGGPAEGPREGRRTFLPEGLQPGEEAQIALRVDAPGEEGVWLLRPALVQERIAWFFRCPEPVTLIVTSAGVAPAGDAETPAS